MSRTVTIQCDWCGLRQSGLSIGGLSCPCGAVHRVGPKREVRVKASEAARSMAVAEFLRRRKG